MDKEDKSNYIEVEQARAMVYLPVDAYEVRIEVSIVQDGKLQNAFITLGRSELERAFKDAEENYIDDEDRFVLTKKGREYVERLMKDE